MSLAREIGKALIALNISRFFKIERNGYKVRFYPTSMSMYLWEAKLRNRTVYEDDEAVFRSFLRSGDIVIDVGANIGILSLAACTIVGQNGHVYSFEAHPKTSQYLKGNVEVNNFTNITTYSLALGEKKGKVRFANEKNDDLNKVTNTDSGIEVEMDTLDNILNIDADSIALLKIDVEGYEKFVLEGADIILKRTQCVFFESSKEHFTNFGYSTEDLNEMLFDRGFELFRFTNNELITIDKSYVPSNKFENLIAVRDLEDFLNRTNYELKKEDEN